MSQSIKEIPLDIPDIGEESLPIVTEITKNPEEIQNNIAEETQRIDPWSGPGPDQREMTIVFLLFWGRALSALIIVW